MASQHLNLFTIRNTLADFGISPQAVVVSFATGSTWCAAVKSIALSTSSTCSCSLPLLKKIPLILLMQGLLHEFARTALKGVNTEQ